MATFTENALPDCLWQLVQWQTATITGEIVTTTHRDSLGRAWVEADGERVATLDRIIYAHVAPAPQDELLRRFCYYSGLTPEQALAEGGLA